MIAHALDILIVDDDEGDRKQLLRALRQSGLACECIVAETVAEALLACERRLFHCAIVDYRLPGDDGLSGISQLSARMPHMAIIMSTGEGDEMVAAEAIKRGATDYLPKKLTSAHSIKRCLENAIEKVAMQRVVAQQRAELEVFSRVLVHDLKAPLHTILGFASLIEESIQAGQPENVGAFCRPVVSGLKRMGALIDVLYMYTQADTPVALQRLEMEQVMMDVVSNLATTIKERGARVTHGEMPAVDGTPQLVQLLQNLIGNGIKYCQAEIPTVHVAAKLREENVWQFSVKDNGIGIPENHYREVFEPFRRLHGDGEYEGTGLGLSTCKKIVERHGGTISCESEQGQGTTFFFTLPVIQN